ncbi:MAG: hypothetical protein E4H41_09335 [Gemmatimonadales bacterium]|jgi:hypothetical protein|nr:MAG: hypothetical protein E4H41_09335 [Gemmatimonadales bacterium]
MRPTLALGTAAVLMVSTMSVAPAGAQVITGVIDTLHIKIGPSQMSNEEQHKAVVAVVRATD